MTPRQRRLARFGLTESQYEAMLILQGGKCAICGKPPKKLRLSVDHDHTSKRKPSRLHGRIRGALCHRCNRYLVAGNTAGTAWLVLKYLESDFDARKL
jgi:hypothetical protein